MISNAKEYQRNEYFLISSIVKVNCSLSHSIISKWTINLCIPICSQQLNIDSILNTNLTEIFIPSRILNYGLYQLKLTIIINLFSSQLSSSSITYIKITPSDIIVNLIPYGTSLITIGKEEDLYIYPSNYSFNQDESYFNEKVCYYLRISNIIF